MSLQNLQAITDVCLLVENIERTIAFYQGALGFKVRRREEGFVDFYGPGVVLAAWEIGHISKHTGLVSTRTPDACKVCVAVELENLTVLDALYNELLAKEINFLGAPKSYPWKAYCAYFKDPDGNLWELYTWLEDP